MEWSRGNAFPANMAGMTKHLILKQAKSTALEHGCMSWLHLSDQRDHSNEEHLFVFCMVLKPN